MINFKNGDEVMYRRGRPGIEDVDWEDWKKGKLNVTYRIKDLPKQYRYQCNFWRKGDPLTIGINGMLDWAEYTIEDFDDVVFLVEDYYLEIKDLKC